MTTEFVQVVSAVLVFNKLGARCDWGKAAGESNDGRQSVVSQPHGV
jgi:hypothetical protein